MECLPPQELNTNYKTFIVKCIKWAERNINLLPWQLCKLLYIDICENPTKSIHILRAQRMVKKINKTFSLTKNEEIPCEMWPTRRKTTPKSMLNTFWWLFTLQFGLQGREEHHSMK